MTTLRSRYRLGVCLVAIALAGTACANSSGGSTTPAANPPGKAADTATFALPPNTVPNWIWPFAPLANFSLTNSGTFQWLMYRPLYWFGDSTGGPAINPGLSLANPVSYTHLTLPTILRV